MTKKGHPEILLDKLILLVKKGHS